MSAGNSSKYHSINVPIRKIPFGIIVLVLFSLLSSLYAAYYFLFATEEHRDLVVPHIGWIGHFLYVYVLLMSLILAVKPAEKLRVGLISFFALIFIYGLYSLATADNSQNYDNPYLTYGTFRPIWELGLPLFWAAILSTKSVKDFCSHGI